MTKSATRCTGHRVKVSIAILMLGVTLTMGPEVFAWGFRNFGGGFGEGAGPGPSGGEGSPNSTGGQVYIYPSRGQSPQQEQNDRGQCYRWAIQQTGFDPSNPTVPSGPPPTASAPQGGLFRGAAGGAALGDWGRHRRKRWGGCGHWRRRGGLFGGMRRRRSEEQEAYEQSSYLEQQQNALNQGNNNFRQAFAVCMTGRGYTVGG